MLYIAEQLTVLFLAEDIGVGVNALFVEHVYIKQVIADLVGGVAEHNCYLLAAECDTTQADCKSVSAEDGEDNADMAAGVLCLYIGCNIIHGCVVALRPCEYRLGDTDDILLADSDIFCLDAVQNALCHDLCKIVALTYDGCSDTAYNCSDRSSIAVLRSACRLIILVGTV